MTTKGKSAERTLCVFSFMLFVSAMASAQNAVFFYRQGKVAQNAGDWYTAVEQYQESVRLNPAFFDAQFSLAQCFYELEEYDRAFFYAGEAEKLRANSPDVQTLKGFVLIGLGRLAEAETVFTAVLKSWPNNINARFGLGELDIAAGRITAAENQYMQALHRSPENRRALLSLALICQEEGKSAAAANFIEQALKYYGDNAQTLYIAGVFEMNRKNYGLADRYLRSALAINPEYIDALGVLASVLYYSGRYQEMNEVADRLIQTDRNQPTAWYQKALALANLNRIDDAVSAARSGLNVGAEDEIMRLFAEELVLGNFSLEDERRAEWASARFRNAASFERHNMAGRAVFEYRRGLKLNPYDTSARAAFASLLLSAGYPSRYLEEMSFIQALGDTSTKVSDAVENYGNLLAQSVSSRWNIDPLYVDKGHISMGIYFFTPSDNLIHPGVERTAASALSDALSFYRRFSVRVESAPVEGYAEAFRKSRERGEDFFAVVSVEEGRTDIALTLDVYVSRSGSAGETFSVFRTGNGRFSSAVRRMADAIDSAFPVYGTVLRRDQNDVAVDLGKADGVAVGSSFTVVPTDALSFDFENVGLHFADAAVLGSVRITGVDSDVSEGVFSRSGFFDRMNPGDAVVLVRGAEGGDAGSQQTQNQGQAAQTPAEGNGAGTAPEGAASAYTGLQNRDDSFFPGLFSILRGIR